MKYTEIEPPQFLKSHVRYFWTLEDDFAPPHSRSLGPLVDGCPGLILQKSENGVFRDSDNKPLPEVTLYGQTITRTSLHLQGRFQTLGVRFQPGSLKQFFEFDANDLYDSCIDLKLLSLERSTSLSEQLLNSPSSRDQIDLLIHFLTRRLEKTASPDNPIITSAISQIIRYKGNIPLKAIREKLSVSERTLERKFQAEVGMSPKLFAKICRFRAAWGQMQSNNFQNLSDIAFDNGYADQSHFIRNFKEFAGASPYQFLKPLLTDSAPSNFIAL